MLNISKIDKYISKKFLKLFLYILIAFQFLNIIIDLFDRLEMFVDNNATISTYIKYYIFKTPYLIEFMFPIAVILATIITLHNLIKNNEIIILFNAGKSFLRIILPIIILSFLISIVSFLNNEFLKPHSNYKIEEMEAQIKGYKFERKGNKSNFSYRGKNFFYNIGRFNYDKKKIYDFLIEKIENNKMIYRATADTAIYTKKGWLCKNVYIQIFQKNGEEYHIQIKQPFKYLIYNLHEKPIDFAKNIKEPEEMSFIELKQYINNKKSASIDISKYIVKLHMKFSFPLLPFFVSILGLGVIIKKPNLNLISSIGISMGLSFIFWGIIATFQSLGTAGKINPVISAWLPNLLMLIISSYLILTEQNKTFK